MSEALGISSCWINSNIRTEKEPFFNSVFNEKGYQLYSVLAFGYSDKIPLTLKKIILRKSYIKRF